MFCMQNIHKLRIILSNNNLQRYMEGVWSYDRSLHDYLKKSFVDFEKSSTKDYFFRPCQTLYTFFSGIKKPLTLLTYPFHHFFIVFIYYWGGYSVTSKDWLIDYCSTTIEQYFSYIQDENKFNNYIGVIMVMIVW
jgi:hypothetical protein